MKIVWHWLLLSLALYGATYALPGRFIFDPFYGVFVVGAVLMFINSTVKPVIRLLTLPITIITLGLFSLIINGAIFWVLAQMISGFAITSFTAAVIGAALVSIFHWVLNRIFHTD